MKACNWHKTKINKQLIEADAILLIWNMTDWYLIVIFFIIMYKILSIFIKILYFMTFI